MNKIEALKSRMSLPVIVAPMFILSDAEFVIATCKEGLLGTFPALNGRTAADFEQMLIQVSEGLEAASLKSQISDLKSQRGVVAPRERQSPDWQQAASDSQRSVVAPYGVNLIVHPSNTRLAEDLPLCIKYKVPFIVTNLGKPDAIIEAVHSYGGVVFSSVTTIEYARKTAEAGVDGLVLICAGAGGHAGMLNPFAFVPGVREFFKGSIAVSGCISDGYSVRACEVLGADFAWVGTRFIPTVESKATQAYKDMVLKAEAADIIYTSVVSGIPANFIRENLMDCGYDVNKQGIVKRVINLEEERKLWKDIWTAGQGIQTIHEAASIKSLADTFKEQYRRGIKN